MKKWFFALGAMVMALAVMMMPTEYKVKADVLDTGSKTVSTSDDITVSMGDDLRFTYVAPLDGSYEYDVFCNGEALLSGNAVADNIAAGSTQVSYRPQAFYQSGTYQYRIRYKGDPVGNWVYSNTIEYTLPGNTIDAEKPVFYENGSVSMVIPENAAGFWMQVQVLVGDEYANAGVVADINGFTNWIEGGSGSVGETFTVSIEDLLNRRGPGQYRARVMMVSEDPFVYAGAWTEYSDLITWGEPVKSKERMSAPTGLTWDGWIAKWSPVEGCKGYYCVALYEEGNSFAINRFPIKPEDNESWDMVAALDQWGYRLDGGKKYYFTVEAVNTEVESTYFNSVESAPSEAKVWGIMPGIAAPADVAISSNGGVEFTPLEAYPNAEYYVEMYLDDGLVLTGSVWGYNGKAKFEHPWNIDEEGVYAYRVRYVDKTDPYNVIYGDWSELVSFDYKKPAKKMAKTTAQWDYEKGPVIMLNAVEDCIGFSYELGRFNEETGEIEVYTTYSTTKSVGYKAGSTCVRDLSKRIEDGGKYAVRVKMLSGNVFEIAHGDYSEWSELYDTTKAAAEAKDVIKEAEALVETNPAEALKTLVENMYASKLQNAMQTDADVAQQMKDFEDAYAAKLGIDAKPTVTGKANDLVDVNKIQMVGAALNATGKNVALDMSVPSKPVDINDNKYTDSVQLDIKLVQEGTPQHGKLQVPIKITMPVPNGAKYTKHMVILHYCADGSVERLYPALNEDGTISFTVSSFSTFVFANEIQLDGYDDPSGEGEAESDDDDDDDDTSVAVEAPKKDVVPKTGDGFTVALPMAMAACFAAASVAFKKKEQ